MVEVPQDMKTTFESASKEEREIKIRLSQRDFNSSLHFITDIAEPKGSQNQKDIYYDTADFKINNLNRGLRVRFDDDKPVSIEFKSLFYNDNPNSENPWFVEEIIIDLPMSEGGHSTLGKILGRLKFPLLDPIDDYPVSYEQNHAHLEQIGLKPSIVVTKRRQVFENSEALFFFDEVEGLGFFVEIEAKGNGNPMEIFKKIFGDKRFAVVRNGYNDMVANGLDNCLTNDEKQKRFKGDPRWNILDTEQDIVEKLFESP